MDAHNLRHLTRQFAQAGTLQGIFLRTQRGVACLSVEQVKAIAHRGLQGDRACNTASAKPIGSKRQVTLIQAEHLPVIASLLGKPHIDANTLRRNLLVSGFNLLAAKSLFKDQALVLTIGEVVLQITGPCEPCSKMETILGHGGYNAMRGHGGVTARVLQGGIMRVREAVWVAQVETAQMQSTLF